MIFHASPHGFKLNLDRDETYRWATRPGCFWPCSTLKDRRVNVEFDANGLCDVWVSGDEPYDGYELIALVMDHAATRLPENHPAYRIAAGQFKDSVRPIDF